MIKLATFTSLALLLGATYASAEPMTSGRPAAVLKDSQCQEVWTIAATKDDMLSKNDAVRHIVNFKLTDADQNEQVSKGEFEKACKQGLVQYPKH
jgi:hypothetical protein